MKKLRPIFLASFFFSVHLALLAYLNASMLGNIVSTSFVSVVYTIASALSLVLVFSAPRIISKIGLLRFSIGLLSISAILLCMLGSVLTPRLTILFFILYFSLNILIVYALDLFVEHYSKEKSTGNTRGVFLTLNNIGWVIAPFVSGLLTSTFGFSLPYTIAAVSVTMALLVISVSQKTFKDRTYHTYSPIAAYHAMRLSPPIRRVVTINFMLQFFFAWMVLYVPLYLLNTIGFDWKTIGILLSIMLFPFALFPYPVGRLIDRMGEKPFIVGGLFIMAVATLLFSLLGTATVVAYAVVLFLTRVGASILEVSLESYFFKRMDDTQTGMISMFRNMVPIAYIIGPMLAALLLIFIDHQTLFLILAGITACATLYAFRLKQV